MVMPRRHQNGFSLHALSLAHRVLLRPGKAKEAFGGFSSRMRGPSAFQQTARVQKGSSTMRQPQKTTSAHICQIVSSSSLTSASRRGRHDKDARSCSSVPSTQLLTTHTGMKTPLPPSTLSARALEDGRLARCCWRTAWPPRVA